MLTGMSAYTQYHTTAFVCKKTPFKEADMQVQLLTNDFGLVRVRVLNARGLASKHRMLLQLYSFCEVSLLKGKAGWRLVGIRPSMRFVVSKSALPIFASMSDYVLRLTHGEDDLDMVFDWFKTLATLFEKVSDDWVFDNLETLRIFAHAQLIGLFGYASLVVKDQNQILEKDFVELFFVAEKQKQLRQLIHEGLVQSQLV